MTKYGSEKPELGDIIGIVSVCVGIFILILMAY